MPAKPKESFTQADVKSILNAAQAAWDAAKPSTKKVTFIWGGHKYQSRLTNLRMFVETLDGTPIAARFH